MKFATASCLVAAAASATAMIVVNDPGNPQFPQAQLLSGAAMALPVLEELAIERPRHRRPSIRPSPRTASSPTSTWPPSPPTSPPSTLRRSSRCLISGPVPVWARSATALRRTNVTPCPRSRPPRWQSQVGYFCEGHPPACHLIFLAHCFLIPNNYPPSLLRKHADVAPPVPSEIEEDVYPFVLELETVYITQSLRRVTEVVVLETRTVLGNTTWDSTLAHGTASGHGVGHVTGTAESRSRTVSRWRMPGSSGRFATTGGAIIAM
nr:hypothetical protein CFP56_77854 [Quercus suber]